MCSIVDKVYNEINLLAIKVIIMIELELKYFKDLGTFLEAEIMIDKEKITKEEAKEIEKNLLEELKQAKILNENAKRVIVGYVELYLLKHNKKAYDLGMLKLNWYLRFYIKKLFL